MRQQRTNRRIMSPTHTAVWPELGSGRFDRAASLRPLGPSVLGYSMRSWLSRCNSSRARSRKHCHRRSAPGCGSAERATIGEAALAVSPRWDRILDVRTISGTGRSVTQPQTWPLHPCSVIPTNRPRGSGRLIERSAITSGDASNIRTVVTGTPSGTVRSVTAGGSVKNRTFLVAAPRRSSSLGRRSS